MTPARRFLFRLALASGYWAYNPDAMLARMPYRVWLEWVDYAALEPFGEERADWRAGMIAATVANCMARKKGQKAYKPDDFMPNYDRRVVQQRTPDELYGKVQVLNQLFGGEFIDKRETADGSSH